MDFEKYNSIVERYLNREMSFEDYLQEINEVIKNVESPLKDYYLLNSSYARGYYRLNSYLKPILFEKKDELLNSNLIEEEDKQKIKCSLLDYYFDNSDYMEANKYADELQSNSINDYKILNDLAIFYTKTRRISIAEKIYEQLKDNNNLDEVIKDYNDFLEIKNGTKKMYMPALQDKREKYIKFLNELGIEVEQVRTKSSKQPTKIPVGEYPDPQEHMNPDFLSFVAFDLETTGFDPSKDAITEIGAIKVIDGKMVETKDFVFQELVHPYKKKISKEVEEKTGITNDMVINARDIWEVFPEFVEFIGNNILVGYNCMMFDSNFMVRAGRLSNLIINNEYYDVMKLAKKRKNELATDNVKLNEVAKSFNIVNPQAHRALADAITTAKVYLELYNKMK